MGQLRRIDAVRASPIFVHFDESIVGATSIRAYKRETQYIKKCENLVDESQRSYFMMINATRYVCTVL